MSALQDLIAQIADDDLRGRIEAELKRQTVRKKFGLVFEEHLPEMTPLYGVGIKKGGHVCHRQKDGALGEVFTALAKRAGADGASVLCAKKDGATFWEAESALVAVAEAGEAIYPYLEKLDGIYNADVRKLDGRNETLDVRNEEIGDRNEELGTGNEERHVERGARNISSAETSLGLEILRGKAAQNDGATENGHSDFALAASPLGRSFERRSEREESRTHTVIQAENYHALQLLRYLYAGKVDCIYIDPPYNTGARDWKYNNDYVDASDAYRHSKWLSMMKKRLALAKTLLKSDDSVLIVTIDEKEYLHLGCLLEELFPDARMQMVSSVINPKGVSTQQGFRKADEYIYFVMFGNATPIPLALGNEWSPSAIKSSEKNDENTKVKQEPDWTSMMRRGSHSSRFDSPNCYYAIYVNPKTHTIQKIGETIPNGKSRDAEIDGLVQVLPIRTNGEEGCWQVGPAELANRIQQGRVRLGKETAYGFVVNYLPNGEYQKILNGDFTIEGKAEDGSLITSRSNLNSQNKQIAPTQWKIASHDASAYGSTLVNAILCTKRFSFPKSLYAVRDALRFFVADKPDSLILDFFAGSGTTLHAVNLLNAEDGGRRRCILVTNNEVSADEEKSLRQKGLQPGDAEWEALGIARHVTWPRTVCAITGRDAKGEPLKGAYLGSGIPMSAGFAANAEFFRLGFLDKTQVALGEQFFKMIPALYLKAGAWGACPDARQRCADDRSETIDDRAQQNCADASSEEAGVGNGREKLRGFDCVAKGDGLGGGNLRTDETFAERRTVFSARPDETGGGVDSVEHSGRLRAENAKGISTVSSDDERLRVGVGNVAETLPENQLPNGRKHKDGAEPADGNSENNLRTSETAKSDVRSKTLDIRNEELDGRKLTSNVYRLASKEPSADYRLASIPPYLILPQNRFAVLADETRFEEFLPKVAALPEIKTVFLITDFEGSFRQMKNRLRGRECFQLYRDYLDNFRLNVRRE